MTKGKKEMFKCTLISCVVSIPHLDPCFFTLNSKGREVIIITYQRFNVVVRSGKGSTTGFATSVQSRSVLRTSGKDCFIWQPLQWVSRLLA